jgi:HAD superfamily hydrolase (TIGR01509 family)
VTTPLRGLGTQRPDVLLCDADGNLFPSEEPAYDASADVTNALLAELGADVAYTPEQLRLQHTGKNFRTTAVDLCLAHGIDVEPAVRGGRRVDAAATGPRPATRRGPTLTAALLEHWVELEKQTVTRHLGETLRPDPSVHDVLASLRHRYTLALVSSSALVRLDACLTATALTELFPAEVRFSAEDSLSPPRSKPDPAVYRLAGERLGCQGSEAWAVEDSVTGAQSAIAAGFPTVGNLQFVPEGERRERATALASVGVRAVLHSWGEIADVCPRGVAVSG